MAASQPLLVLDVVKPIPFIEARPGDRLVLRPGHAEAPFVLIRDLPDNYALTVLSDSEATVCDSQVSLTSQSARASWRGPRGTLRLL